VGAVAGAALASGAASVGGLALATRALGAERVGPLAVAWTLAVVVGPGLWSSVEQEAARATATGEGTVTLDRLVGRRAALAAVVVTGAGLALRYRVFGGSLAVPFALAAIAAAYGPLHLAWGRLAGARRSGPLAVTIVVEGVARLVLVGGTVALTHDLGAVAAALTLAVGLAAAAARATASPATPRAGRSSDATSGEEGEVAGRIRSLTWAGLLSQGLFLTSPATFELVARPGDPRTARLAMAVLLARAPALAWKGVLAAVVPAVAADAAAGPRATATIARAAVAASAIAAVAGAAVAVAVGEPVLDALTGPGPHLGSGALALLAVATAAYLGALTVTSALAGAGRSRAAATAWLAGAAAFVVVAAIPGDALRRVVTALAAGTTVALAGVVGPVLGSLSPGAR